MLETPFEILFTTDGREADSRALADSVMSAWPDPRFRARPWVISPEHLDSALSGRASARRAVVALVRHTEPEPAPFGGTEDLGVEGGVALASPVRPSVALLLSAIRRAAVRGIPTVLLTDEKSGALPAELARAIAGAPSVTRLDLTAIPHMVAGVLFALARQREEIVSLRDEVRVARAAQLGLRHAIDRLHEELELAARVQREYLPASAPKVPGFEIGVLFRPCGYVSGDIYDFRVLDERRTGILLADAVGHGVPAALFTMSITRALQTHESADGRLLNPAEAVCNLNRRLCEQPGGSHRLATGVYAVLDARERTLTLASAGHPSPLLFSADGVRAIESDGLLLGVEDSETYTQTTVRLQPGDAVIFFTDGLESAFPDAQAPDEALCHPTRNHIAQIARLCEDARNGASVGMLHEQLALIINEQRGSLHQADDVTVIVLRAL